MNRFFGDEGMCLSKKRPGHPSKLEMLVVWTGMNKAEIRVTRPRTC